MASIAIVVTALGLLAGCGEDGVTNPHDDGQDTPPDDSVTVDLSEQHQIIRGFGGATVFRLSPAEGRLSEDDMDLVFGNGEGQLGFTIHRIRVISDQSPSGREVELHHARGAIERGAKVIASPWSPPARMKTNGGLVGGSLKRDAFAAYAEYLNDFAEYMSNNEAPLYAISLQNEPDIEVDYESCEWSPTAMRDFLRDHGSKITETRVIAPESFNFNHGVSDPILDDKEAAAHVDIIGGHIYGGGLQDYPRAREMGKELWMTEHLDTLTTWEANLATGKEIHDSMAEANFSAYLWWYVKRFYGPLNENGQVSKRGYIMAQYSKFIRPGYHRVGISENFFSNDVHVSAYNGDKAVVVALNLGDTPMRLTFTLQNGDVAEVTPYRTTENTNLSQQDPVPLSNGSFTYTLAPESITTFEEN